MNISELEINAGSKVWYIDLSSGRVYLLKIIEEIIKKTENDQVRTFSFLGVFNKKIKKINSSELKGEYFASEKEAHEFLVNKASKSIERMLKQAEERSLFIDRNLKKSENIDNPKSEGEVDNTEIEEGYELVEMPDGTKAKVRFNNI